MQVTDLIQETEKNVQDLKLKSTEDVKKLGRKAVCFSKEVSDLRRPMRGLLVDKLYHHYRVVRMSDKAKRVIKEIFNIYLEKPQALPPDVQKRIERDGVRTAVCDYIAGMTDRYALDEYKKLFEPYEKV
jgi:dGTPase